MRCIPWVAYLILPVFAFANAGLALGDFALGDVLAPVPLGVAWAWRWAKPVGVVGAALLARATGLAKFPEAWTARPWSAWACCAGSATA